MTIRVSIYFKMLQSCCICSQRLSKENFSSWQYKRKTRRTCNSYESVTHNNERTLALDDNNDSLVQVLENMKSSISQILHNQEQNSKNMKSA